jgi:hypothetical protein
MGHTQSWFTLALPSASLPLTSLSLLLPLVCEYIILSCWYPTFSLPSSSRNAVTHVHHREVVICSGCFLWHGDDKTMDDQKIAHEQNMDHEKTETKMDDINKGPSGHHRSIGGCDEKTNIQDQRTMERQMG